MSICPRCNMLTLQYRILRGEYRCIRRKCGYVRLAKR